MTEQRQEQSTQASKLTKLERLQKQKERLEQKKESLKAEARRIAKAEAQAARKTRAGQLVALGLACEAMLKSGELTMPLASVKKALPRKIDQERALEIIRATVAAKEAQKEALRSEANSQPPQSQPPV